MNFFGNLLKRGKIEENPTDAFGWNAKGINLTKLSRFEEGLKCFEKALELEPGYEAALINTGVCYAGLHDHTKALFYYKWVLGKNPVSADAWYNLGRSEVGLGEYRDAVYSFTKALEINPRYVDAWKNKGYCLSKLGEYKEELGCYQRAEEIEWGR